MIQAYVVIPFIGSVAQPPVRFNSAATTQTVSGLTNGVTYRFAVYGVNQLGNDSARSAQSDAVTPAVPATATAVSAGISHSCGLLTGGTLRCWGANSNGELGNGTTTFSEPTPVTVNGISTASAISGGFHHSCALLTGGTLRCWGRNVDGELGNGTNTDSSTPVTVTGISTATAISSDSEHACALLSGGTLKCWGNNFSGQLGNGTTTDSSTPVPVVGL
ncbi:MAG: hypothetical protein ABIX10_00950 [Acidimicrobiales bacterium]